MIQIKFVFFIPYFTVLQLLTYIHLPENTLGLISKRQKKAKNQD